MIVFFNALRGAKAPLFHGGGGRSWMIQVKTPTQAKTGLEWGTPEN
jgi:hypothetical protein